MTMKSETLTAALVTLLGNAAGSNYRVIGYQNRSTGGDEVLDNSRLARVFYSGGEFPKSAGSLTGPVMHDPVYGIEVTVSKAAEGDLATIEDSLSTPAQLQTAIAGIKTAESLADASWDECAGLIWTTLMDAQNQGLGLDQNEVGSRWVERFRKNEPVKHGGLVVLVGVIDLSATIEEVIGGDTPQTLVSIDLGVEVNGDETQDPLAGTINDDFTP